MRLFRFRFEDGAKCGGCNRGTRDLYVLAETREEAKDLLRRGEAGLCADCMCELLSGEHPSSGKEKYIIQVEVELPEEIPLDELLEMEGTILDYETFDDLEEAESFLEEKKKEKPTAAIYTELDRDVYLKGKHYVNRTGRYIVVWPLSKR